MKKPLVTIVCACYNHQSFVKTTLNSVAHQTYTNIELIIVDDASTDNSVGEIEDWLLHYPDILFLKNSVNIGHTKSFNQLAKYIKGDFIIDLAADDVLMPNAVAVLIQKFQNCKDHKVGIVYGNFVYINQNDAYLSHYFEVDNDEKVINKPAEGAIYETILSGGKVISSVSSMVKKEVYEKLGWYNEDLLYEDLDFWIKAARKYHFYYLDEIIIKKRELPDSLSAHFFKKNQKSKKINRSTYKVLRNTLLLNQNKSEHKALQKRIHYQFFLCLNNQDYILAMQYVFLKMQLQWEMLFRFSG